MSALDYYTMLLRETRKTHRFHIREARKWSYCLRDACTEEARSCLRAARRYIKIIREARNGD
jgi:hypothetical protein